MANEYAVNQADLTAVADAIRTKCGTSDALAFPSGFVGAIAAIQAGSGGGSGSGIEIGSNSFPGSVSDMLHAIVSGTAKVGSFKLTKILSSTERELVFDTGLDSISNLALFSDKAINVTNANDQTIAFVVWTGDPRETDNAMSFRGLLGYGGNVGAADKGTWLPYGTLFMDGGKVYGITGNTWNNALYTVFAPNLEYWWVVW